MTGKNCVAIASDTRFGVQQTTISGDMERIFKVNNRTLIGLSGLQSDVLTVKQKLMQEVNLYTLNEDRDIKPSVFNNLVSGFLYGRRFGPYFVEPLVAGLEEVPGKPGEFKPFISGQDLLGASVFTNDFVVCGTSESSLFGTAESFYRPDMNAEELFETLSQTMLAAVDRDCLAGWGGVIHILTPEKYIRRKLKGRHD
eukprot:CAMPEP_0204845186 /NCGR_PEP_ID=MMETSP1347-20130617/957_1 /ASSEMBLY_ACC=CAM_ASM_000690 /TAXON_ID=215587 /ORGANISM="Aplanochytrium stocchinoi, Strain GSBS06" /LENGTH=197 /DNA_ID=CAMNT_0051985115 /DNA_START=363 /DNA_END=956 /DNA_ORIENTATION=+